MKVLLSWINDYVKVDDINLNELVSTMSVSGFEIEEVIDLASKYKNIKTCKILEIKKHPNADTLSVCQIDVGKETPLQIITNATNMHVGDIVCVSLDGAVLADGTQIKSGVMRGEKSEGMFCGYEELAIDNSVYENCENDGLFILKSTEKVGEDIAKVLNLNEVILDVSVLPNRPDCNSIIGIAREIAAMFGREFKMPNLSYSAKQSQKQISVSVKNQQNCPRYMGCVVENINCEQTPSLISKRLKMLGHNPHSTLVDITNYVLIEMGQPMHAFDLTKIAGQQIVVRNAFENEKIVALDEKEYVLSEKNLVIADENKALVIAGVMGGVESGTYETTKDVFLESAVFNYANIRRTSNSLGLASDSSNRYAKGVAFSSAEYGLKRALALIDEYKIGEISNNIVDVYEQKPKATEIVSSVKNINTRASLNLSGEEMVEILNNLQIKSVCEGDKIVSVAPEFRTDLELECDICEEIARIYGIDNVIMPDIAPTFSAIGELTHEQENVNLLKESAVGEGYFETINYRYTSPTNVTKLNLDPEKLIKILNPIGQEYSLVRNNLVVNGLNVLARNQKVKNENVKIFEIAPVFLAKKLPVDELPTEQKRLLLIANSGNEDFYSVKASLNEIVSVLGVELEYKQARNEYMHPGITAEVMLYNKPIGYIGVLHPTCAQNFKIKGTTIIAEIDLTAILQRSVDNKKGNEPSKLPSVCRDLAFVVKKDFSAGAIVSLVKKQFKQSVENVSIFDIYEGENLGEDLKSVAIKFYIKQNDKTLTDVEINDVMNKIIDLQLKQNGAKLRN